MRTKMKNPMTAEGAEMLMREMIDEGFRPWVKQLDALRKYEPGSAAYRDALCELWTLSNIVEIKAKVIGKMIDEYLDVLPDDEDC